MTDEDKDLIEHWVSRIEAASERMQEAASSMNEAATQQQYNARSMNEAAGTISLAASRMQ